MQKPIVTESVLKRFRTVKGETRKQIFRVCAHSEEDNAVFYRHPRWVVRTQKCVRKFVRVADIRLKYSVSEYRGNE